MFYHTGTSIKLLFLSLKLAAQQEFLSSSNLLTTLTFRKSNKAWAKKSLSTNFSWWI